MKKSDNSAYLDGQSKLLIKNHVINIAAIMVYYLIYADGMLVLSSSAKG